MSSCVQPGQHLQVGGKKTELGVLAVSSGEFFVAPEIKMHSISVARLVDFLKKIGRLPHGVKGTRIWHTCIRSLGVIQWGTLFNRSLPVEAVGLMRPSVASIVDGVGSTVRARCRRRTGFGSPDGYGIPIRGPRDERLLAINLVTAESFTQPNCINISFSTATHSYLITSRSHEVRKYVHSYSQNKL